MPNAQHSSVRSDHMTPREIVEATRLLLGGIDMDPASSAIANKTIGATRFYSTEDNGFDRSWGGRVLLNPPGGLCDDHGREVLRANGDRRACGVTGACGLPQGHEHRGIRSSAAAWWWRLAEQYRRGNVMSAVFVGFSVEILRSTQVDPPPDLPLPLDFPLCFPARRLQFIVEQHGELLPGTQPTHSSVLVFLPPGRWGAPVDRFREIFGHVGRVVVP